MKIKRSKWKWPVRLIERCPRCDKREPHFVPPSLGEPGFYLCEAPMGRVIDHKMSPHQVMPALRYEIIEYSKENEEMLYDELGWNG